MISILLITQKNSKFFSKFLISYLKNTDNKENIELLILANAQEEWNKDFFEYHNLTVFYEDWNYGRLGRNIFFNYLAEKAHGDWLWHMCDDHYLLPHYDTNVELELLKYDASNIHCVIPRVDNSGSISHILSRGWYETVKSMGWHPNIDSYINNVLDCFPHPDRIHHPDTPVLHDFTTNPEIMTPEHNKIPLSPPEVFDILSDETRRKVEHDAYLLHDGIIKGL